MCRWLAYSGGKIPLDDLIFNTRHSLIDQSVAAKTGNHTTNGDGFGVGWYGEPASTREYTPATTPQLATLLLTGQASFWSSEDISARKRDAISMWLPAPENRETGHWLMPMVSARRAAACGPSPSATHPSQSTR